MFFHRRRAAQSRDRAARYTINQLAGMAGIVLFLSPIFYTIIAYLTKGSLILILALLRWGNVPEVAVTTIMYVLVPGGYLVSICGTYVSCEYIWPKKYTEHNNRLQGTGESSA